MKKLFRKSLFGLNKKDVNNYVEEICANFEEQINELNKKLDAVKAENESFKNSRDELETKKQAISDAIISAQEKGEKIIADARERAEKDYYAIQHKVMEENKKLIKLRRNIYNIKKDAIKTINNLVSEEETNEFESEEE
ncbi:MAG: DivIVA domain-containing protein [Clostridia bacterium]|nr:DivIVA domain-containing protein [Clostridia bacterium]